MADGKSEGGHSCPPGLDTEGGQECPLSDLYIDRGQECPLSGSYECFFDPRTEVDKRLNRLPHWQQGQVWVFVTWRLADSLPKTKLDEWYAEKEIWLNHHPKPWDENTETEYQKRFSLKIEEWLDQGIGSCVLNDPVLAGIVANALHHFDGEHYSLGSFVVMPNHVHVLFRPLGGYTLPDIMKSWKGFTAREINKRLDKSGKLWQEDYFDRLIRDEKHFIRVTQYIRENWLQRIALEKQK